MPIPEASEKDSAPAQKPFPSGEGLFVWGKVKRL